MFLSQEEIEKIGFKKVGKEVKISDKAVFYNPQKISVGDYSRIDDFTIISAPTRIGRYVHLGAGSLITGKGGLVMGDYSGISGRVSVYTSTDTYDGTAMTNPCIPEEYRNTLDTEVIIEKHVVIGAGSVILPGTYLSHGCAVGALSMVSGTFAPDTILAGVPAKAIKNRSRKIYELAKDLEHEKHSNKESK